ncbi:hypothetical protein [Rubripirellula reticaptiva]|uniref:Secreted protein n=1 Tax=Rubripirellula reticaptiva TaxID=2528013 RepID=A0A5C6F1P8_9BACT|nr:hypothetical protein [Rubripirellula reticaptiva]TWU55172.1 hypothetical protein Poly59_14680 [Rubripirellula reticaptiva]
MKLRISSQVVTRGFTFTAAAIASTLAASGASAQGPSTAPSQSTNASAPPGAGYYTDPATGIVYRQVAQTIERPVYETKMQSRDETVYTPQTVHETRPETRTVYTPITTSTWQPRVTGRWNPFQQPTVEYQQVPQTRWEARNEIVQRTQSRTQWIAEKRKIDVPQQFVRMEREQKIAYEPVGRVAPPASPSVDPTGISAAVAARLRPLDSSTQVQPMANGYASAAYTAPRISATSVGRMTSDPPRRNAGQSGMVAKDLMPAHSGVQGQALPPSGTGGVGIANLPALPFFR